MIFPRSWSLAWLLPAIAMTAMALGEEPNPSRTVLIPLDLSVSLNLPEAAVIGDHVGGEFIVTNTGKTPVKINTGGDYHPSVNPWLQIRVWDDRAKILPNLAAAPLFAPAGSLATVTLGPGESRSIYCPLEGYAAILKPGEHTVSAWCDFGWGTDQTHRPLMASATVDFKVPNEKYLAARVRTLCATETAESTWELEHLWSPLLLPALRAEAEAGQARACLGMSGILSEEANRVLLAFAVSKDPATARMAAYALSARLPSLADPEEAAFGSGRGSPAEAQVMHLWQAKFDAPLLSAAVKLLGSRQPVADPAAKGGATKPDALRARRPDAVSLGARIVEARGGPDQTPALLEATGRALAAHVEPRTGPDSEAVRTARQTVMQFTPKAPDRHAAAGNKPAPAPAHPSVFDSSFAGAVLFGAEVLPPPLDALTRAIDALRRRGWRTNGAADPGTTLALLRQLADPRIPRPSDPGWQDAVRAALDSKSPFLRESAVRVMPVPVTDDWEPRLRKALADADDGVVGAACPIAGNSGRQSLMPPLVEIVKSARQHGVRSLAVKAAEQLGGGMELWQALGEAIPEPAMMTDALMGLIQGTMELPPGSVTVQNNLTPEQSIAERDAWKTFLAQNRELLESGKRVPRDDPSITPTLTLGARINPAR